MKITRNGNTCEIIDETQDEYCVAIPFNFAGGKTKTLKLWWNKKYCRIVEKDK